MTDYSNIRRELFHEVDNSLWNGSMYIGIDNLSILNNANQQLVNAVATGPQDEFYEEMDRANETLNRYCNMNYYGYRNNYDYEPNIYLNVGNNWNWKPGTYDKIKEAIKTILCLDKKCMSTGKLVQRTRDMSYRLQSIEKRLDKVEEIKRYLKRNNYSPNVDVIEYREMLTEFSNEVELECEKIKTFNNNGVNIEIIPFINISEGNERNAKFYLSVNLSGLNMNIVQGTKTIHTEPLDDIHIFFNISLREMIKCWKTKTVSRKINHKGLYLSEEHRYPGSYQNAHCFEHPYLSAPTYNYDFLIMNYGVVCLDKYVDDVYKAISKVDYISLIMNLVNWASYYSTDFSNPYNQPNQLHFGLTTKMSEAYVSLFQDTDSCSKRKKGLWGFFNSEVKAWTKEEEKQMMNFNNSCNAEECILRDNCTAYQYNMGRLSVYDVDEDEFNKIYSILGYVYSYYSEKDNTKSHNLLMYEINQWLMSWFEAPYLGEFDDMARFLIHYGVTAHPSFMEEPLKAIEYYPEEELSKEEIIKRTADEMLQWATERRV